MIGKHLLIHSCTVKEVSGLNRDGGAEYGESILLEHVRIVPAYSVRRGTVGKEKDDKLLLFIDGVNSAPRGFIPKTDSAVFWQGQQYTVRAVTPCYTAGRGSLVHHWELSLV